MFVKGTDMPALADFDNWGKKIPRRPLADRDHYFLEFCKGRDVVHLGACDAPFAADKAAKGDLLHQKLKPIARTLIGLDYDQASIDLLRTSCNITDIQFRDLSRPDESLQPLGDVVLCADTIEHVNNVGDLLYNCNRLCREGGDLLVSTINASGLRVCLRSFLGKEAVHPDHVAYYSFATLGVMCRRWGFEPVDVRYFSYASMSALTGAPLRLIFKMSPAVADGIVLIARKMRGV